jgi:hypothetical protein
MTWYKCLPDVVLRCATRSTSRSRTTGLTSERQCEALYRKDEFDRLLVITDEQSHDNVPAPKGKGYVINVASNKNGVGYGKWTHIDGWSESVSSTSAPRS